MAERERMEHETKEDRTQKGMTNGKGEKEVVGKERKDK
jgi:hypothetical protein